MKKDSLKQSRSRANLIGGQAMIIASIYFLVITLTFTAGIVSPLINDVLSARSLEFGSRSFFSAESLAEDLYSRISEGVPYDLNESLDVGALKASVSATPLQDGLSITSRGDIQNYSRAVLLKLFLGQGAAFNYGVQSGEGGVILENSSSISGNVYSNGPIDGAGGNLIKGDAVSAGPSGLIRDVHATSSAYANRIENAVIDEDAHYVYINGSTVSGTLYPGSADQPTSTLPISDEMINEMKSGAEGGGVVSSPCPYVISADVSLGPVKIACDLQISGDPVITLTGNIWVEGDIEIKNTAELNISPSLGAKSVAIIADDPANGRTKGKISLENSSVFNGSGAPNSYVLFISGNRDAEEGGTEKAIEAKNSLSGKVLLYAGHGEISLQNSINIKEVTAYRIRLKNTATVVYETGLANLLFDSGPAGGYSIESWKEVE